MIRIEKNYHYQDSELKVIKNIIISTIICAYKALKYV